jgi:hypothetical protein
MKTVVMVLCILMLACGAYAEVVTATLKGGQKMTWVDYWEQGSDYCINKNGGITCIPKSIVVSITEVKKETTAEVIYPEYKKSESTASYIPSREKRERDVLYDAEQRERSDKIFAEMEAAHERQMAERNHLMRDHKMPLWQALQYEMR